MPASEEPQEGGDPLVGGLALVDREVIGERPGTTRDPVSWLEPLHLGQLDEPVASRDRISLMM